VLRSGNSYDLPTRRPDGLETIAASDLRKTRCIGEGQFGQVWEGSYLGGRVAIKVPKPTTSNTDSLYELTMYSVLGRFPNVPELFGCTDDMAIVMQLMPMSSVEDVFITRKTLHLLPRLREKATHPLLLVDGVRVAYSGAAALTQLHKKGVLHRDVAARNYLVEVSGSNKISARICDFGLSRVMLSRRRDPDKGADYVPLVAGEVLPVYQYDPEALRTGQYSALSEVYSFGCFVYELFVGKPPFSSETCKSPEKNRELPAIPADLPKPLAKVMVKCWEGSQTRETMSEILDRLRLALEQIEEDDSYSSTPMPRVPSYEASG